MTGKIRKHLPSCDKCGALATRANLGPRAGMMNYVTGQIVEEGSPNYLCETDFDTYKASHGFIDIMTWLRLERKGAKTRE